VTNRLYCVTVGNCCWDDMEKVNQKNRGWLRRIALLAVLLAPFVCPAASFAQNKPVDVSSKEMVLSPELKDREAAIANKEKELARRENELNALQKEVEAKLEHLNTLQLEIKNKLAVLQSVKDKRFRNLIKVYSAMSASKVAPLLNQMDDADAVEILMALKAENVAKIIPKLDKAKAIRLSKQLGLD